uniref:Yippee-like 2b n=1 Tax=Paramormyrops kingsleyae TaxID=1676925 RepID=A0A3B3SG16_9TELE
MRAAGGCLFRHGGVCPPPTPTTALTCVLRCFPCEPSWAGSPFLHRPPSPPPVSMTRSKTFQAYLPSCHRTYSCIHCRAHLANHDELISKSFQGSQGRAYLFNSVVNVGCGPAEERVLLTGLHAVADIYCENCKTTLGWKYVCGSMGVVFGVGCMMFDTYPVSPRGIWGCGGSASPWAATCIAPVPFGLGYLYSRLSGIPAAVGTRMSDVGVEMRYEPAGFSVRNVEGCIKCKGYRSTSTMLCDLFSWVSSA